MARSPILPANKDDPTGQLRRTAGAYNEYVRRLAKVKSEITKIVTGLRVRTNSLVNYALNKKYYFDLSEYEILRLNLTIDRIIDNILFGDKADNWFVLYVKQAYEQGTGASWSNLSAQSEQYANTYPMVQQLLTSPEYQLRIGYAATRAYEDMKGLTEDLKSKMRYMIADGVATGTSPREVANGMADVLDLSKARALRIARTEMNTAFRRAYQAEADQATTRLGLDYKLLWVSALMATTRKDHGSRHGKLYTQKEVDDFYSRDGNSINCRCNQVVTLVDKAGNPFAKNVFEKMQKQEDAWIERKKMAA